MHHRSILTPAAMILLLLAAPLATTGLLAQSDDDALARADRRALAESRDAPGASGTLPELRTAVRRISPSVVNISTTREIQARVLNPFFFGDVDPFQRNDAFGRMFGMPHQQRLQQHSLGSGVIVSEDGYVLTNNHVVQGADQIAVTLSDGRSFEAEVVGLDAPTDIAVLQVDGAGFVPATLGRAEPVEVGEWVLAVGNPFGLGHTVTCGIVSATGRTGVGVTQYEDFIQTDAAINPGNSGGPLVDLEGRIVGINTAIKTQTGGYMGIGFAIPAPMAVNVMNNLIEHGRVDRGWLGIYIQDLTTEMAESFGFDGRHGVLVAQVVEDGPAHAAGLREGDIITSLDGQPAVSANSLATAIATYASGTPVELSVFRDGATRMLSATIGRTTPGGGGGTDTALRRLGLSVESVTPELVQRHGLAVAEGAFVTEVEPAGTAARLGIRPGDVILGVGEARIEDADELAEALADESLEQGIRLLLDSNGHRRFLLVRQRS